MALAEAFRPAAPVSSRDLFAGRTEQMSELLSVMAQPGQHGVIFGERGVGKTSLATVMARGITPGRLATRVNCDSNDTFTTVWRKVMENIQFEVEQPAFGFSDEVKTTVVSAARYVPADDVAPDDVRRVLHALGLSSPVVVFIDEFDRLTAPGIDALFADTIKTLSDQEVPATIVLVGVADDVDELIAEHGSIERALVQVRMPRMSRLELAVIVNQGFDFAEMRMDADALDRITRLSQGLPHYTHMLAQQAGMAALDDAVAQASLAHVDAAVFRSIEKAQQSLRSSYHTATFSTRTTLYREVLLACALAKGDELGFFAASDVREPLTRIMGRRYEIPAFAQHLNELSERRRGPVLQKKGSTRRFRYRFVNPLLQPHVIMRGLSEGLIDANLLVDAA